MAKITDFMIYGQLWLMKKAPGNRKSGNNFCKEKNTYQYHLHFETGPRHFPDQKMKKHVIFERVNL